MFSSATEYPVTQRHITAEENPHTSVIFMVMSCTVPKDNTDSLKVQFSGTNHSEDMFVVCFPGVTIHCGSIFTVR